MNKEVIEIDRSLVETKKTYDLYSNIYRLIEIIQREISREAIETWENTNGDIDQQLLEVGCGVGGDLKKLAEKNSGYTIGIDISSKMIKKAKKRIKNQKTFFLVADARKLPFRTNSIDTVYLKNVLELFSKENQEIVLKEIKRVLKPGGFLLSTSMNREGYESRIYTRIYEWLHKKIPRYIDCRPIYLEELLTQYNYKIIRSREIKLAKIAPFKIALAKNES